MGGWFIGYKFHLITTDTSIYEDLMVFSAGVHDGYYLKLIDAGYSHLKNHELLGDRGYIGKAIQLSLFEELKLDLSVPFRCN